MNQTEKKFIATVYEYYALHGRHSLPWRKTHNPYRILVSEIMLQQTQVDRVIPKYKAFLKQFPTASTLARAPLSEVLLIWQGLGYNRRAKMLHDCARVLMQNYNGVFPRTYEELIALPGVGPYTSGAILAFAYNIPVPLIETNIRTVYLHHFFPNQTAVSDSDLWPHIKRTLQTDDARSWYAALMDYGSHLKATIENTSRASKHYVKQTPFAGSDRQLRGAIIRTLSAESCTQLVLEKHLSQFTSDRIVQQLHSLLKEGLVMKRARKFCLPH